MNSPIYKSFVLDQSNLISQDEATSTYKFVMTKQVPDRGNSIVHIDGVQTKNFINNPIVLYNHNLNLPIGRVKSIYIEDKSLIGEVEFHRLTPTSVEVSDMVEAGYLKTVSIGFLPMKLKVLPITKEQLDSGEYYETSKFATHFEKSELFELSVVTVPAHPSALRVKNIIDDLETKGGAVLNSANTALILSAIEALNRVLESAGHQEPEEPVMNDIEEEVTENVELVENSLSDDLDSIVDDALDATDKVVVRRFDETLKNEILKNIIGK